MIGKNNIAQNPDPSSVPGSWQKSLLLVTAATLVAGGCGVYALSRSGLLSSPLKTPVGGETVAEVSVPEIKTVTALGYLEPSGEVIQLAAPTSAESNRVEQLLVKEGDWVKQGEIIAILDSRNRLQAALQEAMAQVEVARSRLQQIQAGAKQGEIKAAFARWQQTLAELEGQVITQRATIASVKAQLQGESSAQRATIERIKAELNNAGIECDRYLLLYQNGAVSASARDSICLQAETAQERLEEAKATLNRILTTRQEQIEEATANLNRTVATVAKQAQEAKATTDAIGEVRPVDVQVAAAELEVAKAAVSRAEANLDLAEVRSPIEGQVLEIHTRPGELIAPEGIAELGQTQQMYAVAEVYESDAGKISLGQSAKIFADSLPRKLEGTVEQVGLQVRRQEAINTDPAANIDAKVVEVRIKLDQAATEIVAGLTNLQVKVTIDLNRTLRLRSVER